MKKLKFASVVLGLSVLAFTHMANAMDRLEDKSELKVISYNAYWGMKSDLSEGKVKFAQWAKQQDADVIAWQEMNHFTRESLEKFAASYGHSYAVLLKEPKVAGEEEFFPTAITSKYPITNVNKIVDNMWHGALFADIGNFHFVVTHLNSYTTAKRIQEINLLLDTIKYSADPNGKWIIAGDLNSLSPLDKAAYESSSLRSELDTKEKARPEVQNLVNGQLDYTVQQNILDRGFIDVLRDKYPNEFIPTAPTKIYYNISSIPLRYDYIHVSPAMKPNVVSITVMKDEFTDQYSDHYPVQLIVKNK